MAGVSADFSSPPVTMGIFAVVAVTVGCTFVSFYEESGASAHRRELLQQQQQHEAGGGAGGSGLGAGVGADGPRPGHGSHV